MQTEARVGVVVEGGGLNTSAGHGAVVVEQGKHRQQLQIGTVSQLLAGGVAGAVSKTCTAPLARLTILFQVQGMHSEAASLRKANMWREASRILREEGFCAFWKGNLVTIVHRLPYSSVSFCAFEHYKNFLQFILGVESQGDNISTDLCIRLVGGGLAGITAASVTYPLDLVRTRLAAQTNVIYYRGIFHAFRTISKEEGVSGLYKGLGATLLGVGPNLAISFSVYDTVRSCWHSRRPDDSTVLVSLACGSLSGIASSTEKRVEVQASQKVSNQTDPRARGPDMLILEYGTFYMEKLSAEPEYRASLCWANAHYFSVTFPLDLLRRRMQLEGAGGRALVYKTGLCGTFRHIFRSEGLRGLYRGILPEYFKVVPGVGIVFMTYEKLKQLFSSIPES